MTNAGLTLPSPVDGEAALTVTLDWLRTPSWTNEFEPFSLQQTSVSGASDTLAERLRAAGLKEWGDAIISIASPGQSLHLEPRLEWLMGRAALEISLGIDHPSVFPFVEKLKVLGRVNDATLASEICVRVVNSSEDYPLLERLRTRLQLLWNSRFNERLRRYAEATSTRPPTSRELWPRNDGLPVGDGWAHRVAATLWPDRYMGMLATFPAPFQHGLGSWLSPLDSDLVASLIRAAPGIFSSNGAPIGPVVVFVLLNAVETWFATIDVQDMGAAEDGLGTILDSIFSRNDGDWIGRTWLQRIIWQDTPRRAGRAQADVCAQRILRSTLLLQLSGRITPLREAAFDWVCQEEPLWAVHRVLSEASILEAHGNATEAAEILAGAVRRGLVSATNRPAGLVGTSPEATIVVRVLSHLPDMKQWFETLWHETYELREQLSYPAHRDLDNPAYPALTWGLIGLNSSQLMPVETAAFWRAIAAAVFETQRIDPNASLFNGAMPPLIRVTVQLGAALVERGILPTGDFADFLADQLEPTAEHASLWQIARSEASDTVTLVAGRLIGASLLRQALEEGLAQDRPAWDATLDRSARDDLAEFSRRL